MLGVDSLSSFLIDLRTVAMHQKSYWIELMNSVYYNSALNHVFMAVFSIGATVSISTAIAVMLRLRRTTRINTAHKITLTVMFVVVFVGFVMGMVFLSLDRTELLQDWTMALWAWTSVIGVPRTLPL